ncbi:MAG: MmgE/PrpD family protein [Xanthobacteraceae bacterium]
MAQAEALQMIHPARGATQAIIAFVNGLRHGALSEEVRHYASRHLTDTVGVMIAGARSELAERAEAMLATVRSEGCIPVPGRARRADLLDAAYLGGTAAHGIELDDGFRQGSVHPGCVVVPAVLALGYQMRVDGKALMEAIVAGYEAEIAIGRACHPDLRQRGFHPAATVGVFGSVVAAAKLRGLSPRQISNALGLAASSAAGLFAFVNGGADVKRLHAGHASREGRQAALLAEREVEGPPDVIETRDGFMQAFAFGPEKSRVIALPPLLPFGITDCYIKPYPCCRHIQPAIEALIGLLNDERIATEEVERIDVATYRIAAEHAQTGWDDFASAQLSFPFLIGLALRFRAIKVEHFSDAVRAEPEFAGIARKLHVSAPPDIDRLYPQLRPARVTVTTARGTFTRQADEALGSRIVPLDDAGVQAKFLGLVAPVLGSAAARTLCERLWSIEENGDVAPLVESMAL